jgi:hypothetical protein
VCGNLSILSQPSRILKTLKHAHVIIVDEISMMTSVIVAEQRVTGPKLQGCVACVKPGTEIRVNLVASIHEWRRILS